MDSPSLSPTSCPAASNAPLDACPETSDVQAMHAPIMREASDPRDGYEPVPMWLAWLFGALIFWGGWYLAMYSADWRGDMLDPDPSALRVGQAIPTGPVDPMVLGEKLFKANCVSCHQADGNGQPGQYPPLSGSQWVLGPTARLIAIPLHGIDGPLTVKGQVYNGNMPTFAGKMNDEKLAAVLTYIRKSFGNVGQPVTGEMVAAVRAATKDRTQSWSEKDLASFDLDLTPPAKPQ